MRRFPSFIWLLAASLLTIICNVMPGPAYAEIPDEAQQYRRDLTRIAQAEWGLDAPVATFAAQVHQESRWQFDARSPVGAQGLGQVMPTTATWLAGLFPETLGNVEPYNPAWSLMALVSYDVWLAERIKARSPCEQGAMVLASYNGGLGWLSLAQAKVHNEVRLDLLEADAKAESNTLNRQFVRPFCDLNFAPGRPYPRLVIDVPKPENLELLIKAVSAFVPLGLRIEQSVIRDKFGLPEPAKDAEVLGKPAAPMPAVATAANREQPIKGVDVPDIVDNQVQTLAKAAAVPLDDMVDAIRELLDSVSSLEEFRDRLIEAYPDMSANQLADAMADGMAAASLAGRYDVLRGL